MISWSIHSIVLDIDDCALDHDAAKDKVLRTLPRHNTLQAITP